MIALLLRLAAYAAVFSAGCAIGWHYRGGRERELWELGLRQGAGRERIRLGLLPRTESLQGEFVDLVVEDENVEGGGL